MLQSSEFRCRRPFYTQSLSIPCDVLVANRLRSGLKRLLRVYGFRCTRVSGDGLVAAKVPWESSGHFGRRVEVP